ncbi:hypothetical protein A3850_005150 [Lewinella sp. 4G2]|nr:hypothetical protein A3850_005150 [Lewinella sp. 4G2]
MATTCSNAPQHLVVEDASLLLQKASEVEESGWGNPSLFPDTFSLPIDGETVDFTKYSTSNGAITCIAPNNWALTHKDSTGFFFNAPADSRVAYFSMYVNDKASAISTSAMGAYLQDVEFPNAYPEGSIERFTLDETDAVLLYSSIGENKVQYYLMADAENYVRVFTITGVDELAFYELAAFILNSVTVEGELVVNPDSAISSSIRVGVGVGD